MTALAFVDCETSGLDPQRHEAWEIAVIRRENDHDIERLWQIRLTPFQLAAADREALKVGRHYERAVVPHGKYAMAMPTGTDGEQYPVGAAELHACIEEMLRGAVLVGSNPGFDAAFLAKLLGVSGPDVPWRYRPVDIATLAAGHVYATRQVGQPEPRVPFSSRELSRAVGVEPPGEDVAHTALGDAVWARDVYDAVTGGAR
ncbi:hypothetical protein RM780_04250 [Streptomyces sp. DSM 44917]|uniref:Exonuclease domain-containing protein n=1 Tax=Streptomyces boetiae TaxID=3075541 RepID=A0ABU2L3N6_9ACTN|nr:hypothetical protein [Streptomyces sp. DSM 44917]MDT0306174.1 hypothetical protein [Streptomyces sp. DSM 44917]